MENNQYKCLSILQPWASLCVHTDSNGKALKEIETRSWNTKYRGTLLIHASKVFHKKKIIEMKISGHEMFSFSNYYSNRITENMPLMMDLPLGAIIGKVDLEHVVQSEYCFLGNQITIEDYSKDCIDGQYPKKTFEISDQELAFGDYSPNRFGWMLSNPILFKEPIPCKGQLSIWNLPTELVPLVNQQIELAS